MNHTAIDAASSEEEEAATQQNKGCAYCNSPLFAGRKCKHCGKVRWG